MEGSCGADILLAVSLLWRPHHPRQLQQVSHQCPPRHNDHRTCVTSFLAGCVTFSFLGALALQLGVDVSEVATSGKATIKRLVHIFQWASVPLSSNITWSIKGRLDFDTSDIHVCEKKQLVCAAAQLHVIKVTRLRSQGCLHAFTLRNKRALRARLPYAVPGCSQFLGRSEHTCGMRAQQEDSVGFDPTTSSHLRVWRCSLYH